MARRLRPAIQAGRRASRNLGSARASRSRRSWAEYAFCRADSAMAQPVNRGPTLVFFECLTNTTALETNARYLPLSRHPSRHLLPGRHRAPIAHSIRPSGHARRHSRDLVGHPTHRANDDALVARLPHQCPTQMDAPRPVVVDASGRVRRPRRRSRECRDRRVFLRERAGRQRRRQPHAMESAVLDERRLDRSRDDRP